MRWWEYLLAVAIALIAVVLIGVLALHTGAVAHCANHWHTYTHSGSYIRISDTFSGCK